MMGRFKILIFFMLLLLAACEEPVSPSFRQTDALLSTDLVKGKAMLDSLLTQEGLSKSEQMYGSLLRIKVKDKEYQDIKGYKCLMDSLVCYFENVKDDGILSEVYFYAGRICFEDGEVPQSLQYYQKAVSLVPEDNYTLQGDIYCQMANIYRLCNLPHEALQVLDKAYLADSLDGNRRNVLFDLRDMGQCFIYCKDYKAAQCYLENGLSKAHEYQDSVMMKSFHHVLASVFYEKGDYKKAKQHLEFCLRDSNSIGDGRNGLYIIALDVYGKTHEPENADLYAKWLLDSGNVWGKQAAYRYLIETAKQTDDSDKLKHYFVKYKEYSDTIQDIENTQAVKKIEQLYNFSLKDAENKQLNLRVVIYRLVMGSGVVIFVLLLLSIMQFYKVKIGKSKQREMLQELIVAKYKTEIEKYDEVANCDKVVKEQKLQVSSIYQHVLKEKNHRTYKLTDDDWVELFKAIDEAYPDFRRKLDNFPIANELGLKVCYLLKIHMKPVDIAGFTNRSKEAITASRRRMYVKSFKKEGRPGDWDKIIDDM